MNLIIVFKCRVIGLPSGYSISFFGSQDETLYCSLLTKLMAHTYGCVLTCSMNRQSVATTLTMHVRLRLGQTQGTFGTDRKIQTTNGDC